MASVLAPSSLIASVPPQTPVDGGRRGSRFSLGSGAESTHNGGQTTSPQSYAGEGLLIPTDRDLEELEEKWLPSLGRVRVEKEVAVSGYALYALRTWVLSRTQWSQSIVTQTGRPSETVSWSKRNAEEITAYLLVPEHGLSHREGKHELQLATQLLVAETKAQVRRTDHGTLLVTTPTAWGQDAFYIPGGDLRYAKPFLLLNTDLRRLGCGGKSFSLIGAPPPSTLRRKFLDLYKLPSPHSPPGGSWSENTLPSPTRGPDVNASPNRSGPNTPTHAGATGERGTPHPVLTDPFVLMVQGLVKLIQASLYIWGLYASESGCLPVDGFFCDETKAGVAEWRRIMGFEQEPSMSLDSSGSCIDPRTLAALLSSVTSSRYHLAALGVEKVPKDPFLHPMRFLSAWRSYQISIGKSMRHTEFLSVAAIRTLSHDFAADRHKSGGDTLKLHKLVSGVTSATSQMTSTLKGGDDAPLRKREYLSPTRHGHSHSHPSGLDYVVPDAEVGEMAAPNIITCNLEAYISGILKSKEKEWDIVGARRIAAIWNGIVVEGGERRRSGRLPHLLKRRTPSRDLLEAPDEDGESSAGPGGIGTARHTLREVRERTGQVIRDGIGFVSRRGTVYYETSDSESGKQRVPKKRQQTIPTLIEPEIDEEQELLVDRGRVSVSPSPSPTHRRPQFAHNPSARASYLTTASRGSARPSIVTQLSNDGSEGALRLHRDYAGDGTRRSSRVGVDRPNTPDEIWLDEPGSSQGRRHLSRDERALAWHDQDYDVRLLRTASNDADVTAGEGGLEWEVQNPHGTGKGHHHDLEIHAGEPREGPIRRHSMEDMSYYRHMTLRDSDHLSVDVDLCAAVLDLRVREKMLAKKAEQMQTLDASILKGFRAVVDAVQDRAKLIASIKKEEEDVQRLLDGVLEDLPYDEGLNKPRRNMDSITSQSYPDVSKTLEFIKTCWDEARRENARVAEEAKRKGVVVGVGAGQEGRRKDNGAVHQ